MRKSNQFVKFEIRGTAFDRMNGAENRVNNFWIAIAVLESGQTPIQHREQLFALLEKDGSDGR
jgi:hypothetical protein